MFPAAAVRFGVASLPAARGVLARLLLALALVGLVAACAPADDESLLEAGAAPVDGISGEAIRVSDVETTDDEPWAETVLFAVPFDEADALWAAAGVDPPRELERAVVALPAAVLDEVGAVTGETGAAGKFHLELDSGGYLVCLGQPDGDRVSTVGCGQIAAPALDIVVSTGEAGFTVQR